MFYVLAEPLQIVNKSFDNACIPALWKQSSLIPVYYSDQKGNINYRGISLISTMAKILDSVVTDEIFLTYKHQLADEQHGFCSGR